jgi:HlyD family secretion protein
LSYEAKPIFSKIVLTNNHYQSLKYLFTQPKNRWLIVCGLLGLLSLGTTILFGLNFTRRSPNIVTESTTETVFEGVTALGRIEPSREVIILSPSPNMGGTRIDKLKVSEGEWVQEGQVIALLDNHNVKQAAVEVARQEAELAKVNLAIMKAGAKIGDIEAQQAIVNRLKAQSNRETESQLANWQLRQAELNNATAEFSRYQQLAEDGAISQSELDRRRLILATAQQRVKEAQANYNRTRDTLQEEIREAIASLASIKEVRPLDIRLAKTKLNRAIAILQEAKQNLVLSDVCSVGISGCIV